MYMYVHVCTCIQPQNFKEEVFTNAKLHVHVYVHVHGAHTF